MKINKILIILIVLFGLSFAFTGCVKQNYDVPPSNCEDIDLTATISIQELKTLLGGQDTLKLDDSLIISGYITSTDQYGNQYKELTIQDESGAIDIMLDATYLFTIYPLGQKIFVKCGGIYLGNDYNITKLGGIYLDNGIKTFGRIEGDAVIAEHLIKTCDNQQLEPEIVAITDLTDDMLYKLVKIENVQFIDGDTNYTWADGINQTSENRTITDANAHTLIVRTSGYASFAKDSLPKGSGYIIGLVGKYNADYQLYVRSKDDAVFDNERF